MECDLRRKVDISTCSTCCSCIKRQGRDRSVSLLKLTKNSWVSGLASQGLLHAQNEHLHGNVEPTAPMWCTKQQLSVVCFCHGMGGKTLSIKRLAGWHFPCRQAGDRPSHCAPHVLYIYFLTHLRLGHTLPPLGECYVVVFSRCKNRTGHLKCRKKKLSFWFLVLPFLWPDRIYRHISILYLAVIERSQMLCKGYILMVERPRLSDCPF